MVGVVGSSPIAPTNILLNIKHLAETLGAFFMSANWGELFGVRSTLIWSISGDKA